MHADFDNGWEDGASAGAAWPNQLSPACTSSPSVENCGEHGYLVQECLNTPGIVCTGARSAPGFVD
jgi:hypothetical protein